MPMIDFQLHFDDVGLAFTATPGTFGCFSGMAYFRAYSYSGSITVEFITLEPNERDTPATELRIEAGKIDPADQLARNDLLSLLTPELLKLARETTEYRALMAKEAEEQLRDVRMSQNEFI